MLIMSGNAIILSSLFVLYKDKIRNELVKFVITAHYCLIKNGYFVADVEEGMINSELDRHCELISGWVINSDLDNWIRSVTNFINKSLIEAANCVTGNTFNYAFASQLAVALNSNLFLGEQRQATALNQINYDAETALTNVASPYNYIPENHIFVIEPIAATSLPSLLVTPPPPTIKRAKRTETFFCIVFPVIIFIVII
ncbi:unnamed protein product [Adineta steineri]|uniref:Uncharacterized protein n=1 Tax=Adineta steineri TaxID=433720 RepID=A0A814M8Q8_9BILA|nr:unnamed protein product [Adineta steineri]